MGRSTTSSRHDAPSWLFGIAGSLACSPLRSTSVRVLHRKGWTSVQKPLDEFRRLVGLVY